MLISKNQLNPKFKQKIRQATLDNAASSGMTQTVFNFYKVPESYKDFLSDCCRIRSGNKFVPFVPYDYQVAVSDLIDKARGVIIFKTRQIGITECIAGKFLHKALLNPAYAAAVLSLGQSESSNVATRIESMPAKIKGLEFVVNSKTKLHFKNAGKIWFRPATDNATRSLESISDIFYDESAFPINFEEIYAASAPSQEAVGDAARTIMASTMSELGKASTFWRMFASDNQIDAEEVINKIKNGKEEPCYSWIDKNGWGKMIIHWSAHPVYASFPDYLKKTKEKHKLKDEQLQREYNLGIPAFGGSLFNPASIIECAKGKWETPEPNRYYMAALDPNFGGTDYWQLLILDITQTPYSVVAQYRENNRQTTFCIEKSLNLIDVYMPVLFAIENNSGGAIIAENIAALRPSLYMQTVTHSRVSKMVNTDRLALALENNELKYPPDWEGIPEFKNFSLIERKAIFGHDDCVMCLAVAFAVIDIALKRRGTSYKAAIGTVVPPQKSRLR